MMNPNDPDDLRDAKIFDEMVSDAEEQAKLDHPQRSCANYGHDSDCSTHNEPAMQNGPCDCSLAARPAGYDAA